jgi:DNA polymerase-3 subunit delta'
MPEAERVARGLSARSDFERTPSQAVKVEQIRGLQERLALHALEAKRKVAILLSAERLNEQAQNAFLKTLEEPPSDTTLILVSTSAQILLPTIRSRCAQVPFGPLPRALIASRVAAEKKLDVTTAELVADLSEGSLGRALEMDTRFLASRQEVVTRFEALDPKDARTLLSFAETFGGSREHAESALSLLALWVRDVLALKGGRAEAAKRELSALAAESAARRSEFELLRAREWIEKTRYRIGTRNGQPRLQLERMLIALTEGA